MGGQRDVLVTLADRSYLDQAKQFFSSAYFNGGWGGDYLLLAHDIPDKDLEWFYEKGILIKHCAALFQGRPGGMSNVLTSKLYLFASDFQQWRTVIYSDADASVRASLDGLRGLKGFYSVCDISQRLGSQIVTRESIKKRMLDERQCDTLIKEIVAQYNLHEMPFCAGFFAFDPAGLDKNVFSGLRQMLDRYAVISEYGDQLAFNLFFYHRWKRLPVVYNIQVAGERNLWNLPPQEVPAVIIHFISPDKPWIVKNYFYSEWLHNFERADQLELGIIPKGRIWDYDTIVECDRVLGLVKRRRRFFLWLDRVVGKIGQGISRRNKGFYKIMAGWKRALRMDRILGIGPHVQETPRFLKQLKHKKDG